MSEVAVVENNVRGNSLSTIKEVTIETRKLVAKAVMSAKPIAENLNKRIDLVHVLIRPTQFTNEKTGVVDDVDTVYFIDVKNEAYSASSNPLADRVREYLAIMGDVDTWGEPQPIAVKTAGTGTNKYYTLEVM